LLEMIPSLPDDAPAWSPGSTLLDSQGLAILRDDSRYASLECGLYGGGHGHPDRLHLTLHADGRHWLADPGTGSYVSRDLFWYRSTLAHNAPRLDGLNQPAIDAWCSAFDVREEWSLVRGVFTDLTRTLVAGRSYLLDILELSGTAERLLELPWHLLGETEIISPGSWVSDRLADEFVGDVERLDLAAGTPLTLRAREGGSSLTIHLLFDGELLRARGPGRPGGAERATFYLARVRARNARLIVVLDTSSASPQVRAVTTDGPAILVETGSGTDRHLPTGEGWEVTATEGVTRLGGARRQKADTRPLIDFDRPTPPRAIALHLANPPALDGSLEDFDAGEPLLLDHEDQYRRSEEAYAGPEEFSATALIGWDSDAVYIGVDVVKADTVYRPADAPPLRLDNEPDDLHSDGLQLYFRPEADGPVYGFLVVPADDEGGIRVHVAGGNAGDPDMLTGAWRPTDTGYTITVAVALPGWSGRPRDEIEFDLLVNEMYSDRVRRAGQLVWTGGGGWAYLRGDRQPPSRFGVLELK